MLKMVKLRKNNSDKKVLYRFLLAVVFLIAFTGLAFAAKKPPPVKEIIYIPHDDRPISMKQTAEIIEKAGYKIVMPPKELLGSRDSMGKPTELWKWYENLLKKSRKDKTVDIIASVLSTDSLIYGSLVGSRKHNYSDKELIARMRNFILLHKKYPEAKLYVFSSIMRTPKNAAASGHMEPAYYDSYGEDIFRYTALIDKQESAGLNARNKRELKFLESVLPRSTINDWKVRRNKNFTVNKALIDFTKNDMFTYLLFGRDDNAPYSATHQERRKLLSYAKTLSNDVERTAAGIDEAGLLLLTRAVLKDKGVTPNVYVRYNWGSGEFVVPAYSDEAIKYSINDAINIIGANPVDNVKSADLVLTVNTNPNGKTGDGALYSNSIKAREGTRYFVDTIEEYLKMNKPVAVADIAFANGSDNALMDALKKRKLLFKLTSYAGTNTATNSTGFALSTGLLAKYMKPNAKNELLKIRYLDDWMYQGNVRTVVARQLTWLNGDGVYGSLNDKREWAEERVHHVMNSFLKEDLPVVKGESIKIVLPWNRMFEADILSK